MSKHRGDGDMTLEKAKEILAPLDVTINRVPDTRMYRVHVKDTSDRSDGYSPYLDEAVKIGKDLAARANVKSNEKRCARGHHWVGDAWWCPSCQPPGMDA